MPKFLLVAVAVALFAAFPLHAQSTVAPSTIPTHLENRDYPAARAELGQLIAGRPDAALFAAHLEALIMLRGGQPEDAADVLRQILDVAPNFEPARRELTVLLAQMGQTESAVFHAERLLNQTDDQKIQRDMEEFISTNQTGKENGISVRFTILPSTNANKGTNEDTIIIGGRPFTIDPVSKATDGLGFGAGITAWNSWRLTERWTRTLSGAIDVQEYLNHDVNDDQNTSLRFDFGRDGERNRLSFGPVLKLRMRNWNPERHRVGLSAGIQQVLNPRTRLSADVVAFRQTHRRDPFRDGNFYSGSIGIEHAFSRTLSGTVSLPFTVERTQRAHLDHNDIGLTLGVANKWRNGLNTSLSVRVQQNQFIGNFPNAAFARRDVLSSVGFSLNHSSVQIGRFTPNLGVTFTDSSSNIGFYDFSSTDMSVGFQTGF